MYIANGLMVVDPEAKTIDVKVKGHDYQLQEPKGLSYHWELDADILHPMIVNGKQEMLRLLEDSEIPEGMASTDNYYKDGDDVYYRIDGKVYHSSGSDAALTATNIRRSNLNLTKTVQGKDAPSDALFAFKLKVNSANGLDGKPEDLWFSVWTGEEIFVDLEVEGAPAELDDNGNRTGYFYVSSGTAFTVKMQPDWNLRFTNVLTGTTYEFEETDIPTGFEFVKVECNIDEEGTEKDPVISGQKISGTVVQGDTSYVATFTNKFEFATATPEVTKELSVPEGITGPDDITGWYTFTLVEANGGKMQIAADEATVIELNKLTPTDGKVIYDGVEYTKISDSLYYYEATELTVTNPDADGGTAAFGKLLFNKAGTYKYTVTEAKSADKAADAAKITDDEAAETGKTVTVTVTAAEDGSLVAEVENVTFTNKYEPETIDVTVEKIWDDDNNRDKIQPASVSVVLTGDNEFSDTQTLNADNEWTYTWSDLLKYADYDAEIADEAIKYSLEEVKTSVITGTDGKGTYAYKVTGNQTDGFKVTNTHTPEKTTVTVTKVWDDSDNQDGIRPATVQIKLMAEGEAVGEPVSLPIDGKLTYTWTDLNKNKDGVAIEYTVEEVTTNVITGKDGVGTYAIAVSGTQADGYKVTNTHTPEVTERTVKKEWADANNQDGIRPKSVTMILKNGDTTVATVTLPTEDGKWEATVDKLPKYAGTTTEINYTWVESPVPTGYKDTYAVSGNTTTVTNTHSAETTEVTVTKVWEDADNQDGIRPATVQIKLLAGDEVVGEPITLPIDGELTYTWEDLPKYAGTTTPIVYTVEEVTTDVITGTDGVGTYAFKVEGSQAEGFTVTNAHTPETTEIEVTKVWDDASNQDGKRSDSVTYQLYAGTEKVTGELGTVTLSGTGNTWTAKVAGLPKYAGTTTAIEYSVKELDGTTELAEGGKLSGKGGAQYTVSYTGKLTVKNSYTPEETERTVVKVWSDNGNQDGVRPTSLTVKLLADGAEYDSVTLNEGNSWTATVDELPVYKNGTEIVYSWSEQLPADSGYTQAGEPVVEGNTTTITNKHAPDEISVSVEKIWDDADNQDGLRPSSVTVQLKNGTENVGEAVVLNADNSWKYTWTGLAKNAEGKAITYTVEETEVPEGYTVKVENKGAAGTFDYKVTNTHTPAMTEFTVKKVWDDDNNRDGVRPASVTAVLMKDGKDFDEQVLNEGNNWTYTWTDLDKYAGTTTAVVYTAKEKAVPAKYEVTVEGGTITNSYAPERVTVPVEKVWDDANNQDGKRPESITVALKADGTQVMTAELNEENSWKYTFESTEETVLYKNKDGKAIVYTVKETAVPEGYTKSQEGNIITNTHTPELIEVTVKKEWNDNDNNDGKRPTEITVSLKADGTAIRQLTLNEENKWTATEKDLPKYKDGKEIAYTFGEMTIDGYTPEYSEMKDGVITITNTHEDELITVKVVKEWKGDEGYDVRPESLEVVLKADGKEVKRATLNAEAEWKTEFTEMPKYNAGKEIVYTADETEIPVAYEKTGVEEVEKYSFKITNEYKPVEYDPPVKKVLVGDEGADTSDTFTFKMEALTEGAPMPKGGESGEKTITLKAGEEFEFGTMYLTKPGTYKYLISEVDEGKEGYTYSGEEYELEFVIGTEDTETSRQLTCKLTVNGEEVDHEAQKAYVFEFENEYRKYVDVEVEKIWLDNNDSEKKRPAELEVTLYANNEAVETVKLNAENGWKYTWEDQPYSDKDYKEIKYTVKEDKVPEGYKATTAQSENKTTITNTIKSPETGDNSNLTLWLTLLGVSATGVAGAAYVTAKKKKEDEE
ncbi:MAG: Cna B-type domain-containing protein [Erysipelotrichaceae bacterium]|nr:Cna B-type domain-containing protein [Erysipelotrichaceae bacterium]